MNTRIILKYFIVWRVLLFFILFLAIQVLPLQFDFIGGGLTEYLKKPFLWSWANFDGEHFLDIARNGYKPLTYFYFPGFPFFVRYLNIFGNTAASYVGAGLLVSNLGFLGALYGIYKLVTLDFKKEIANITVILLLLFPTSFYFGALYSEGVFLMLIVWSFYLARKKNWLVAGILASIAGVTRLVGVGMLPALICEVYLQRKDKNFDLKKALAGLAVIPISLMFYMFYLYQNTGDPLDFLNTVAIFGQQRSANFVLLPQVFYRYIFKVLPNISYNYWPAMFIGYMEFLSGLLFTILAFIGLWKLRLSWSIYTILGLVLPTLSGSFSSMPRYVLVLFPAFITLALILQKSRALVRYSFYSIFFLGLVGATALFVRGYWIA